MSIIVKCECGKTLSAPDNLAGKKARCPGCSKVLTLPAPSPGAAVAAARPAPPAPAPRPPQDAGDYELALPDDLLPTAAAPAAARAAASPAGKPAKFEIKLAASPTLPPPAPPPPPIPRDLPSEPADETPYESKKPFNRDAPRPCPACGAFMAAGIVICPKCGFSPNAGQYTAAGRYATHDKRKSYGNFLGIDMTVGAIVVILLLLCGLGGVAYWYSTGPGAKFQITDMELVDRVVAVDNLDFTPQDTMNDALHRGMMGGPNPELLPDDIKGYFHLGGGSDLLLTAPDPHGDYVLIHAKVSQRILQQLEQQADYNMAFNSPLWKIVGPHTSISPTFIVNKVDAKMTLGIEEAQSPDVETIIPGHAKPAAENDTRDERNQISGGTVVFDGTGGISGNLTFQCFRATEANPYFSAGISATGLLKVTTGNIVTNYSYDGSDMTITWDPVAITGWWTKERYFKPMGSTDYAKFSVIMIFPRPADDQVTLMLKDYPLKTINLPAVAARTPVPVSAAAATAPSGEPLTDYLELVAKARTKLKGELGDIQMQKIGDALFGYVVTNGHWPDKIEQVPGLENGIKDPRTGDPNGYIYIKPIEPVKSPETAIVIYEAKDGTPLPDGDVLFADGHVGKATQ